MAAAEPYDGLTLIVDTSTWLKLPRAPQSAKEQFAQAAELGRILCSPVMLMEVLYGVASAVEVEEERDALETLRSIPVTTSVCRAAVSAMVQLAYRGSPGNHKVKGSDLLIAASAADGALGVLHHDHHFDKLAEVLAFDSVWFADPDENNWQEAP
ncbi:MAG: PIN domain-containing protein [Actinobacteria bacterium]|nr:PIN domain-containing protein [Actinomycetota bacterium]